MVLTSVSETRCKSGAVRNCKANFMAKPDLPKPIL